MITFLLGMAVGAFCYWLGLRISRKSQKSTIVGIVGETEQVSFPGCAKCASGGAK